MKNFQFDAFLNKLEALNPEAVQHVFQTEDETDLAIKFNTPEDGDVEDGVQSTGKGLTPQKGSLLIALATIQSTTEEGESQEVKDLLQQAIEQS